ncbi:ComEC/Rec2 family competence protein [Rhizobium glycinendophyticum]|uniref:ComEC family competence protein n=1 Tax=Rhizobium glycinendophyticum TaxID=2589807 RepID=A0A504UBR3_9HYPH|nr:ComEC/Rec2 family competence protein [Rhizobium glycinendophyticum]TPP11057.1 ComEC family competence protein [Rhizobium glycinendophyticum]
MVDLLEGKLDLNGEASPPASGQVWPALSHTRRTLPPSIRPTGGTLARAADQISRLPGATAKAVSREIEQGHLFFFVPVCLGLGAVIWFNLPVPPAEWALMALSAIALVTVVTSMAGTMRRFVSVAGLLVLAGMALTATEIRRASTTILDTPVLTKVTGLVERREAGASGEWRYVIRLLQTEAPILRRPPERVSLLARSRHQPLKIGDALTGRARLSPPSGPALPGMNDFAFQSYFAGIGAVGFFMGAPQSVTVASLPAGDYWVTLDQALFSLRDRISDRIHAVLPGDTGAFAASIITGERRSMSKEATDALRLSGLAHITAISGLNMALAAGIFFVGLRGLLCLLPVLAQRYPIKKVAAAGALLAATAYVLISGYQVSALRAYLMTAVMLVAVLIDRPAISLRNLSVAATLILIAQPSAVMGPSFQMSFAATAALIAGYSGWRSRPRSIWPAPKSPTAKLASFIVKFIGGTLATSLIGGLSTAIFAVTHFHRLSTHGLEANLAAMPLISIVVMPAGFIAMLLMPFGLDAPFFWIMGLGLDLVLVMAHTVAGWGDGALVARQPAWFPILIVTALLLLTLLHTWLRHAGTLLLAITLAAAAVRPPDTPADLFISEDGRLVGFWPRGKNEGEAGSLATNRSRPPAFLFDQWQPALAVKRNQPPIQLKSPVLPPPADWKNGKSWDQQTSQQARQTLTELIGAAKSDAFTCIRGACSAMVSGGWRVVTLDRADLAGIACDVADIVILAARARMRDCRSGARFISATTLRSSGAMELRFGEPGDKVINATAAFTGQPRPWTMHRLYDWRTNATGREHVTDFHAASQTYEPNVGEPSSDQYLHSQ